MRLLHSPHIVSKKRESSFGVLVKKKSTRGRSRVPRISPHTLYSQTRNTPDMNLQPFRTVPPASRLLHRTLTMVFADSTMWPLPNMVVDALSTYAAYEQVPHAELLESLIERFEHERHGETVLSSDALYMPLRLVRRGLVTLTRFPITTPRLVELRRRAEACVINDVMRLSVHDLAPTDVALLWGCAAPCTQWALIEQLASRFPIAKSLPLLSGAEFRDVLVLAWMAWETKLPTTEAGTRDAARLFATTFFDVEETWRRLRDDLAAAAESLLATGSSSELAADPSLVELRDDCAMACVLFAATLQTQRAVTPGSPNAFPITAAEWARWVGEGGGGLNGGGGSVSPGVMPVPPRSMGGPALHAWYRRLCALHQGCAPDYVRASFATAVVNDLVQLYQRLDLDALTFFFEYFMPLVVDVSPHLRACTPVMREAHNTALTRLFWDLSPVAEGDAATAPSVQSWTTHQQRGSWTTGREPLEGEAAPASSEASVSASCVLAAGPALNVLLAEVRLQGAGQPLPEAHVPAVVSMLTIVLQHLRRAIASDPAGMRHCGCSAADANWLPSPFWAYWNVNRLSLLAMVLAEVQERVRCAAVQTPASAALLELTAQGTELLRPFIRVDMIEARGTGRMLTDLLCKGRSVVRDLGGAALEAQLQSLALENAQKGFSRTDVARIVRAMEAQHAQQADSVDAKAREVVAGLKAAELTLPVRPWA